ncbi:hypothetical protein Neosp_007746 [[Neocosmospora] mangrovei]
MIKLRTFQVTRPLSEAEIQEIKASNPDAGGRLYPIRADHLGYAPDIELNFSSPGTWKPYIWVRLLEYTSRGLVAVHDTIGSDGKCMVPVTNIQFGAWHTPNKKVVSSLALENPTVRITGSHSNSAFRTWLESFYATLAAPASQDLMAELGIPTRLVDMVGSNSKRATLIKEILNGMTYCDTLSRFQDGLPSLKTIWDTFQYVRGDGQNPQVFRKTTGSFFYAIIYYAETPSGAEYAVYCGQSVEPAKRLGQHVKCLESDDKNVVVHHKIGRKILRKGGDVRMFPITFIERGAKDHSVLWAWAELTLIILFECFNPYMLSIDTYQQPPEPTSEPATDIAMNAERDAFHKTWSAPLARNILDIGKKVKDSQDNLRAFNPRDKFVGCNWAVPILERSFVDANLWVQTTTLGEDRQPWIHQFRTHPKRVQVDRQVIVFIGKRNKEAPTVLRAFKLPLVADQFPSVKPGSMVNVVIEITANPSAKHPAPYLQIPSVGPFDCWAQASRIGIRIEFLDDNGEWKARYLGNRQHLPFLKAIEALKPNEYGDDRETFERLEVGWVHCMKILATMLHWTWQSPQSILAKRVFVPYNGRVRKYDFDFLKQQIILSNPEPSPTPLPRLRSLAETANSLEDQFLTYHTRGPFPELVIPEPGNAVQFLEQREDDDDAEDEGEGDE